MISSKIFIQRLSREIRLENRETNRSEKRILRNDANNAMKMMQGNFFSF